MKYFLEIRGKGNKLSNYISSFLVSINVAILFNKTFMKKKKKILKVTAIQLSA